jgi:HemY protein
MKTLRLILLIIVALALLAGFVWVAIQPGQIVYSGGDVDVTMRPAAAAIIVLGVTLAMVAIWALLGWLWALPGRIARNQSEAAKRKGMEALGFSLAALESGEVSEARRQAQKALGHVPDAPGAKLLAAKTAVAAGDSAAGERLFGELSDTNGFTVAARKGLAELALARGNAASAISHAEAALMQSRKAPWPADFLFSRRVAAADWDGAMIALDDGEKRGLVGAKTAARRRAVVLSAAAQRAERLGDLTAALELAQRAVKLAPGFAPAAVMTARLQQLSGKAWNAAGTLETAWEREPHPALAIAYRDLKAGEDDAARSRWTEALVRLNPGHRESRILSAEQALEVGDTVNASAILDPMINAAPTSRLLTLRAAVAQAAGDAAGAKSWAAKAAMAAREPDWSDLDPDGAAFAYEDADWGRMVEAYGDRGVLIHPRLERADTERAVAPELLPVDAAPSAGSGGEDAVAARSPDDPGLEPFDSLGADVEEPKKKGWLSL